MFLPVSIKSGGSIMIWAQLQAKIAAMTEEQLLSDVTVYINRSDEFIPVEHFELCNDNEEDRLDDGHPYLVLRDSQ